MQIVRLAACCLLLAASSADTKAQTVARSWFTPPVVPETQTQPVRFEATVSGSPASVAFNYNGVDRPMFDDGTNGDFVAGDGTWTVLFTASEIVSKNTAARVFRPFIGFCKPAGGGSFNTFAEVWTPDIGLREVRQIDATEQETDYTVNYVATTAQLLAFDAKFWARRFFQMQGDKFDFLNFVHVAGVRGNRFHVTVKNPVQGIGRSTLDNTAQYGSAGRLLGYNNFPISCFFDGGEMGFSHETGHQWINFCQGTSFASGIPHWPKGSVAINVMGFSIGGNGGEGGTYNYTFAPNSSGSYFVGDGQTMNQCTFNAMELYLMGMAAPAEVGTFFVLNDHNQNLTTGQTLQPAEITLVSVNDVIAVHGPRVPDSTQAQRTFRCATIVLSEQLLDAYAMAYYDFFARRCEAKQQLTFAIGFATGTCNPWHLATGDRSVMYSKIPDDVPLTVITGLPNGDVQLTFTGKLGIRYQPQSSDDLTALTDEGPSVYAPVRNPPGEGPITATFTPPATASEDSSVCV